MSENIRTFCKRTKQQTWKAITSSSYSHITLLLATATLGLTTQQSTGSRYLARLCTLVAYIAAIFRLLVAVYAVGIGADTTRFFCKSLHMRWFYDFCTLAKGQFKAFGALNSPALEPLSLSHHSFWWRQIWRHRSYWTVSRKLHLVITNNLPDNLPDEASPEGGGNWLSLWSQTDYSSLWNDSYDTIRYWVFNVRSKKLTGGQLSLPHGINKKLKCETKNKMMSVIGPVQSRYREQRLYTVGRSI